MFEERQVEGGLVRICTAAGITAGTGFLVGSNQILTCQHVVTAIGGPVFIETHKGERHPCSLEGVAGLAAIDLAVLFCPTVVGTPLALSTEVEVPGPFWSKGFQFQGVQIRDAIPVVGTIAGTTAVTYGEPPTRLEGVLVLADADINPGLSGAPVLDPEWGACVGVVSTAFRPSAKQGAGTTVSTAGFAISLRTAAAHVATVAELIAANRRTVPAYGPHLNRLVATELCTQVTDGLIKNLVDTGRALPERYCERKSMTPLAKFGRGSSGVFALLGRSGVGKTAELAHLASEKSDRYVSLFLAGSALRPSRKGLADDLERELQVAAAGQLPPHGLDAVVSALGAEGAELVVLVDGLNEVPPALQLQMADWIAGTITWIRQSGARLVVSCRPEFWDQIARWFPEQVLHDRRPLLLEDFDHDEAVAALDRYGLTGRVQASALRHPFLARMYWEISRERGNDVHVPSRYAVLERFLTLKANDVGRAVGVLPVQVRLVMRELARALGADPTAGDAPSESAAAGVEAPRPNREFERLRRRAGLPADVGGPSLGLDAMAFERLLGAHGAIIAQLVRENFIVSAGTDYRFAFDQVAEFLQSENLAETDLENMTTRLSSGELRASAAAFALLRLEATRGAPHLLPVLDRLIGEWARTADDSLGQTLEEVFEQSAEVTLLYPALERYVRASLSSSDTDLTELSMLRNLDLSVGRKLQLLRILAVNQGGWRWEQKRWDDLDLEYGFAGAVTGLIKANRPDGLAELARWFTDRAQLDHAGVTVGDVARAFFYRLAPRAFPLVCEVLAEHEQTHVLRLLVLKYPVAMAGMCEYWLTQPARHRVAGMCARLIVESRLDASATARAFAAVRRLLTSAPEARVEAWGALFGAPETRDLVVDDVLAAFADGDPAISPSLVIDAVDTHLPKLLEALEKYFARTTPDQSLWPALDVLATKKSPPPALTALLLEQLQRLWRPGSEIELTVAMAVETLLYRLTETPTFAPAILALATRIAREGSQDAREVMAYFATAGASRGLDLAAQQSVFETLLTTATTDSVVFSLIGKIDDAGEVVWAIDRLLAWPPPDQRRFEEYLVYCGAFQDGFAETLVDRVTRTPSFHPRFELKLLVEQVRAGKPGREVARALTDPTDRE